MPTISRALRHPPRHPRPIRGNAGEKTSGRLLGGTKRLTARTAVCLLVGLWSSTILAAVPWHPSLRVALEASKASQRPVLAIFTASWSSASTAIDRTTLASDEAVALITACFEPVCVDVDEADEMTRRFGITKVPTAVILAVDEQVLAKFEVPETPAEFVAAAARGLKEASFSIAQRTGGGRTDSVKTTRGFGDVSADLSGSLPAFGGVPTESSPHRDANRGSVQGTQAVNAVTAKVRRLSSFACETSTVEPVETAIAASFREADAMVQQPARAVSQVVSQEPATAAANQAPGVAAPPGPTAPSSTPRPAEPAAAPGLQASVVRGPLPLEPGPTGTMPDPTSVPSAYPTTPGQAVPWLGATPASTGIVAATAAPDDVAANTAGPVTAAAIAPVSPAPAAADRSAPPAPAAAAQAASGNQTATSPGESSGVTAPANPAKPEAKPASSLLAALQKPFGMFAAKPKKTAKDEAAVPAQAGTGDAVSAEQPAAEATAADDPHGSMPVGLEGYCPVTLAERGVWVEGRAQWGVRHRGRTYLFAGAEQQKAFLADPDSYAPVMSGDDPVLALDAGKSTPGQRRYGVTYQSRTYLFSSTETRDAFAANPQRYTGRAVVAEHVAPESTPVLR